MEHILLVVGSDETIERLSGLAGQDYRVEVVGSVAEAIGKLTGDYDGIILDPAVLGAASEQVLAELRTVSSAACGIISALDPNHRIVYSLDSIADALIALDQEWRYVYINTQAERVLGRSRAELLGRILWDEYPEVFGTAGYKELQRSVEEQVSVRYEEFHSSLDRWFEIRTYPATTGILVYARDITKRKRAEEALLESEEQLRRTLQLNQSVMTNMGEGLYTVDTRSLVTYINPAAQRLFGWSSAELLGRKMHDVTHYKHPDGRPFPAEECAGLQVLQEGKALADYEDTFIRKDGTFFPVVYSSSAIRSDGTIVGLVVVFRDVTAVKQAEEAVSRARSEAERRAAELQAFTASMADGAALTDAEGKVLWINDSGREILRIPADESLDEWLQRFRRSTMQDRPLREDEAALYRALQGETVKDVRYEVVTRLGEEIVLSVSASPILDERGRVLGATYVFRDQSERVSVEREREELLQRERRIAETLQQALIPPQDTYDFPGCRVSVKYQSAWKEAAVGGDFYDAFEIGEGRIGIVIGDVVGKGLPAAISVAAARFAIRDYAYVESSPSRVMALANQALCRESPDDSSKLLTAFFAVVDTREGMVTYANAGHELPFVRRATGDVQSSELEGMLLGAFCGVDYREEILRLAPGDAVVLVTDGITEARSVEHAFFDRGGVTEYLTKNLHVSLDEIPSGLLEAAQTHAGGNLQDDAAVVAFQLVSREPHVTVP